MRHFIHMAAALLAALMLGLVGAAAQAQEPNVRVIVPDTPGGVIVTGCYRSLGRIYDDYRFEFCLKRRGTYEVTGPRIRCEGRMDWRVDGLNVRASLKRTSCGRGVAWSADSMTCRPNLVAGIIGLITKSKDPLLSAFTCDYKPARGSGEKPTTFVARRL